MQIGAYQCRSNWYYQVPNQANKYCRLWIDSKISKGALQQRPLGETGKSDSERLYVLMPSIIIPSYSSIGRLWIDLKIARGAPPQRPLKRNRKIRWTWVDWCLGSSYQVSAQSDKNCRLWIDFNISRGVPPQRPLGENRKIRDWATMRINVSYYYAKFQLSRPRNKVKIDIEDFKRRASWEEIAKSATGGLCAPLSSIILQSFNSVGHVI